MKNKYFLILAIIILCLVFLSSVVTAQQFSPVPFSVSAGWWTFPSTPTPEVSPFATAFSFTSQTKMELLDDELSAFGSMNVGDSLPAVFNLPPTFDGQSLVWASSNSSVASITVPSLLGKSQMALVTANNPGTAVITVSTADGRFSYSFNVVVR